MILNDIAPYTSHEAPRNDIEKKWEKVKNYGGRIGLHASHYTRTLYLESNETKQRKVVMLRKHIK